MQNQTHIAETQTASPAIADHALVKAVILNGLTQCRDIDDIARDVLANLDFISQQASGPAMAPLGRS